MLEGTVFSSVEEKDRAHLTRTSDTSCMIEGESDDERKTRVRVISGSHKTLMSTVPREMLESSRKPLDSRTELIQVTRKKDPVLMRTVELWQRWFW